MNNRKKLYWQIPFLVFLIIGTILIIKQQHDMPYQHNKGFIFGTVYNITYQSDKNLEKEIIRELDKVDASLSPFNEKSIISKINRNEEAVVDNYFYDVFNLAMQISEDTNGAFDITVAPIVNAWGFGFKSGSSPTSQYIDSLKQFIGYKKVRIGKDKHVVKQDERIMLDCSAIAKGYGSDVVARLFNAKGIKNYMIEIGGEIVASGLSEKRLPWKIGITKPSEDSLGTSNELQTILNITDCAMATSGNYRNFYYKNGKRYAHTIDPRTGYPIQHNILSATVIAKSCAQADAYATSFMVLGLDEAKKILERHPQLLAYLIYTNKDNEYEVWHSPALKIDE
jgi:thiamine biosynthesis lipoprotein